MEDKLRKIVGGRIKYFREHLRLSQQDLSELSGMNRSYIGGVERGERNIGIDNLEKIADGLGVEAWRLLKDDTS